jgi:hypothetical protein
MEMAVRFELNIIRMMSWIASWPSLMKLTDTIFSASYQGIWYISTVKWDFNSRSRCPFITICIYGLSLFSLLITVLVGEVAVSQNLNIRFSERFISDQPASRQLLQDRLNTGRYTFSTIQDTLSKSETKKSPRSFPEPKKVLFRSLMIPGWGQITNKQVWKVPIIYGLMGGLVGYSIYLNKKYHDYRAAYYNTVYEDQGGSDFKFGPTPSYIPEGADPSSLRYNRNYYRNQRDFMYIATVLAYGLNAIDAYIFAHMRSFDVSDDLSASAQLTPLQLAGNQTVGISVSISFNGK